MLKTDSVTTTLLFSLLDQVKVYDSRLVSLNSHVNEQFASARKDLQSIELQLKSAINDNQSTTKSQFEQQLQQIQKRLSDSHNDLNCITKVISSRVDAVEHSLEDKRTLVEEKVIALEQKVDALSRKLCAEPPQLDSVERIFHLLQSKLDKLINVIVPPTTASLRRSESISQREGRLKSFLEQTSEQLHEEDEGKFSVSSTSSGCHTMSKQCSSTHSKILESKFESIDDAGTNDVTVRLLTDDSLHKLHTEDAMSQQAHDITDKESAQTVVEVLWAIEDLISLLTQLPYFKNSGYSQ